MPISVNDIFKSNAGLEFIVINYVNYKNIDIRFISSGFEVNTNSDLISKGSIKDKLSPSVEGVGFIGDGIYNKKNNPDAYSCWQSMFQRSYSKVFHKRNPTYKDCSVCSRWHNFQNFAPWFYDNVSIEKHSLDKDIKAKGNRVYSPEKCCFVSKKENSQNVSTMRSRVFISPDGEYVLVKNKNEFCRSNNLNAGSLNKVENGKQAHHKGWRFSHEVED